CPGTRAGAREAALAVRPRLAVPGAERPRAARLTSRGWGPCSGLVPRAGTPSRSRGGRVSDSEFWSRVDEVFIAAVELEGDAAARAALIEARCGGDEPLLAEVRSLLSAHEQSGGFLRPPPGDTPVDAATLGTVVGAYRLT